MYSCCGAHTGGRGNRVPRGISLSLSLGEELSLPDARLHYPLTTTCADGEVPVARKRPPPGEALLPLLLHPTPPQPFPFKAGVLQSIEQPRGIGPVREGSGVQRDLDPADPAPRAEAASPQPPAEGASRAGPCWMPLPRLRSPGSRAPLPGSGPAHPAVSPSVSQSRPAVQAPALPAAQPSACTPARLLLLRLLRLGAQRLLPPGPPHQRTPMPHLPQLRTPIAWLPIGAGPQPGTGYNSWRGSYWRWSLVS